MATQTFTITQPTKIHFGVGAIADLAAMVKDLGGSKVFLVVDPGLKNAGLLDRITAPLQTPRFPWSFTIRLIPNPV